MQIDFRKPPWGFVKNMIEKNAYQGVSDYVEDLQKALDKEVARLASESGQGPLPVTPGRATPSLSEFYTVFKKYLLKTQVRA